MIMVKEFGLESYASTENFEKTSETKDVCGGFTSSKRIKLSSQNNQQGKELHYSQQTRPLGLTLSKTPSFLNLLETVLSQSSRKTNTPHQLSHTHKEANSNDLACHQYVSEKLKASNFSALSIKIGSFEMSSRYEEELVAKCYYAKKKLVWEVLEGPVKSKMEIQWSDIEAIRATIHENELGILEIELNQPPFFFKETNPQPRKHTIWQPTSDFTGGQASKCRRHIVHFPSGTLDKHYEKLLQCDRRLLELSQKPFPRERFPYFQHHLYPSDISFAMQQANIGEENWRNANNCDLSENHIGVQHDIMTPESHWEIDHDVVFDLENVPSSKMPFTIPDNGNILATEGSMCSFVDPPDGVNHMTSQVHDDNFTMMNYYYEYRLSNPKMEHYQPSDSSYAEC